MKTIHTRTFIGSVISVFTSIWEYFTEPSDYVDDDDPWHTHW